MAEATVDNAGMSRREFLYYIWGASMALFFAEFAGLLVWFLIPKFREGEFGGNFPVTSDLFPEINTDPVNFPDGRFWLVNVDGDLANEKMYLAPEDPAQIKGVLAIYKVCTHLGCIYAWNNANQRFECPCHGSKYRLDGRRVQDPAPRTLDRFEVIAVDVEGNELGRSGLDDNDFWEPLDLPVGTDKILVNTGGRKKGPAQTLLQDLTRNAP